MGKRGGVRKFKQVRGVIRHAILGAWVIKREGLMKNCLKRSARRRKRSATTGFIVEASSMLQETVGVLSDPEQGAASLVSGTATSRVASWRTSAASSKSKLVIVPSLFVEETRSEMISAGQGWRHTRSFPKQDVSSHTPPALSPEASQNPRWVGSRQTILARLVGWSAV